MHALSVSLLRAKQLPVITNGLGASPHAGSTCTIGVVTVRPLNRLPARLYFKLKPDPNNTFFFIFTCTTQYPWVLANLNLSQAMAPSKKKRIHTVFRDSSAHRSASTSKPRFVGDGQLVELGSICELVMGQSPSSDTYNADGEGLPFYQGNADFGEKNPIPHVWCTEPKKVAEKGDILISVRAPIGAINIASEQCCIGRGVAAIRPRLDFISADFLMHQLLASRKKLELMGTGSTFKAVGKKALNGFAISIYPKGDQDIIADQLDCIIQQIKATETQVVQLDQLVKSRFVEMFKGYVRGGNTVALSELCEFVTVGIANAATHAYADDGIVMLRNLNVRENYLDDSDLIKINPDFAAKYSKKTLKAGDILVTRTGYPGIACVVPEKYAGCQTFTTLIARLKSGAQIIPLFLSFWINSPVGKEFVERMKAGSSQQNFGATSLKLLEVPLPPLSLQQEFADFVAQVDKSRFVRDHEMNFR